MHNAIYQKVKRLEFQIQNDSFYTQFYLHAARCKNAWTKKNVAYGWMASYF